MGQLMPFMSLYPAVTADMASGSYVILTSASLLNTPVNTYIEKMHAWKILIPRQGSDGRSLKGPPPHQ